MGPSLLLPRCLLLGTAALPCWTGTLSVEAAVGVEPFALGLRVLPKESLSTVTAGLLGWLLLCLPSSLLSSLSPPLALLPLLPLVFRLLLLLLFLLLLLLSGLRLLLPLLLLPGLAVLLGNAALGCSRCNCAGGVAG
jgi:hypothetical protein